MQVESADAFAVAYSEVLGDAYTALGQVAEAQEAYQKVLMDPVAQGTVDLSLVQWKLLDLPEEMTADASTSAEDEQVDAPMDTETSDDVVEEESE